MRVARFSRASPTSVQGRVSKALAAIVSLASLASFFPLASLVPGAALYTRVAFADPPAPAPAEAAPSAPPSAKPAPSPPPPHRAATSAAVTRAPAAPHYRSYVDRWHAKAPEATGVHDEHGRPKLVIVSLNTSDRAELSPLSDRGGFDAFDLDRAARVLREPSSGNVYPVEPRLVDLVYRIQTQFSAPEIPRHQRLSHATPAKRLEPWTRTRDRSHRPRRERRGGGEVCA